MQLFRHIRGRGYFMSLGCSCGRRHHANFDDDASTSSRAARASSQDGSLLVSNLWDDHLATLPCVGMLPGDCDSQVL